MLITYLMKIEFLIEIVFLCRDILKWHSLVLSLRDRAAELPIHFEFVFLGTVFGVLCRGILICWLNEFHLLLLDRFWKSRLWQFKIDSDLVLFILDLSADCAIVAYRSFWQLQNRIGFSAVDIIHILLPIQGPSCFNFSRIK